MKQRDWNSFGREVPVRGTHDSNGPGDLAVRWLNHLEVDRGRTPNTIRRYDLAIEHWLDWANAHQVAALAPSLEELEAFIRRPRLRQGHGGLGAPATRRAEVTILRGWFRWLHARKLVSFDPTIELNAPTVRPSMPKPVPDDHWLVLWESNLTERLRLALGLAFFAGLRRKEICALRGHQITSELIVNFTRKGAGEDTLPWAQMLDVYQHEDPLPRLAVRGDLWAKDLVEHASQCRQNLMFWTDGHTMYKEMKRACTNVNLPNYTPHQLRHSCATNLVRAGMPIALVSSLLNHSSLETTKRYVRAGGAELREWRKRKTS